MTSAIKSSILKKTLKHQKTIQQLLQEYSLIKPINWPGAEHQIISDTKGNHYQLVRMGWKDGRYHHCSIFHFDIRNGKVWVRQNRTDVDIKEELIELGVAKNEIILAYQLQEMQAA